MKRVKSNKPVKSPPTLTEQLRAKRQEDERQKAAQDALMLKALKTPRYQPGTQEAIDALEEITNILNNYWHPDRRFYLREGFLSRHPDVRLKHWPLYVSAPSVAARTEYTQKCVNQLAKTFSQKHPDIHVSVTGMDITFSWDK